MDCKFCGKTINSKPSLAAHEKGCKVNPDRVAPKHSPLAGQKKGCIPANKGIQTGRNPVWDERYPIESVMVEDSTYSRTCLRSRLISTGLIEYVCAICGCGPMWNGHSMPLILDHINGVNNDHRKENLRFVCSNCDSQLVTYKSRNRRRGRVVDCSGLENPRGV